jgi:hypothetical protein
MRQKRVGVVFFSAADTTARLAEAVALGAEEADADTALLPIMPERIVAGRLTDEDLLRDCDEADALAVGSPTYMGGPAAQFKTFADATSNRWSEQRWAGLGKSQGASPLVRAPTATKATRSPTSPCSQPSMGCCGAVSTSPEVLTLMGGTGLAVKSGSSHTLRTGGIIPPT